MLELPTCTVSGSPRALGEALGEHWRSAIQAFTDARLRALRVNLRSAGCQDMTAFFALADRCQACHAAWDVAGHAELLGVARASGVDPVHLFAAANLTDLRDVALFGPERLIHASPGAEGEGCTAFALPPVLCRDGRQIIGQTWDLNPPDIDFVIGLHRLPDEGPETWSVTLCGCPNLVGMNEHGLYCGTTNIKTRDARIGVGYMNTLHRALGCRDRAEAIACITQAPRAGAHTFWLADADGASELECSATRCHRRDCADTPLVQTNHCLAPPIADLAAEAPSPSSCARLDRAQAILAEGAHDLSSIRRLFADRSDGMDSINRLPEDGTDTTTNSCLIAFPARRELHACRGPADRGVWQQLSFQRSV